MSTKRCNNSTEAKDGQSTSRTSQLNSFSSLFLRHIYLTQAKSRSIYIYTTGYRRQTLVSSRPGSRQEGASPPPPSNLGHSTMFINTSVIRQSIRLIHNN